MARARARAIYTMYRSQVELKGTKM